MLFWHVIVMRVKLVSVYRFHGWNDMETRRICWRLVSPPTATTLASKFITRKRLTTGGFRSSFLEWRMREFTSVLSALIHPWPEDSGFLLLASYLSIKPLCTEKLCEHKASFHIMKTWFPTEKVTMPVQQGNISIGKLYIWKDSVTDMAWFAQKSLRLSVSEN